MKAALLDSNVLIYAANGNAESLREFVCSAGNAVASTSPGSRFMGFPV
jgi:predicted nucleic acid-binding protein